MQLDKLCFFGGGTPITDNANRDQADRRGPGGQPRSVIPYVRLGKYVRFKPEEVLASFQAMERSSEVK